MATFDTVFNRLIGFEGGYTPGVNDPGGETNWGISRRAFPDVNIKALTREQAKAIYLQSFWNEIEADQLPDSVAFQVFDFAVNSGIETAIRYLQRAVGVADDGHFGPVSRAARATMPDAVLIMKLDGERLDFMTRLSNWPVAGKTWARRIAQDLLYASDDVRLDR